MAGVAYEQSFLLLRHCDNYQKKWLQLLYIYAMMHLKHRVSGNGLITRMV